MSIPANNDTTKDAAKPSNFLRQIIEADLAQGTHSHNHWAGTPGDAAHQGAGALDPARIRTRFPPEPNGYLHVGHAKSICLNFGLARDYGGVCHMRFDDTNPEKEEKEYVDSILDAVQWLGFNWESNFNGKQESHLYYASNYFDFMYRAAEYLITAGHAYVDEQTAEDMRINRGDFGKPGVDSPFRSRSPEENLARFREMRDGKLADGAAVLRAKIDMASPNINLRDPAIYRIKRAHHHNTGDAWCIYPMYTYAHPIEDAIEHITHSICTLEFEDQRPFYDWLLDKLADGGFFTRPLPQQIEFARLNLTYVITNYAEGASELCQAPNHPLKPELGKRDMPFSRELWIEREDFMEEPVKGFHRLYPGNMVRLRYGFVVKCTGCEKDAAGNVTGVLAEYMPDSKSGTPGADNYKVKGNLHWVSVAHGFETEVRIYDRLFAHTHPGQRREGDAPDAERDFLTDINPDSKRVITAYLEPALKDAQPEEHFQFERHGYFVADRVDSKPGAPVFNRTVTLKDSWAKGGKQA